MATTIRKQVYNLTRTDLAQYPVWEYALNEEDRPGQDEATVRPYVISGPLDEADGLFVVRASFILADGSRAEGYLRVSSERSIPYVQPIIITDRGQVMFWYGIITPAHETLANAYSNLGKRPSETFPLRYQSEVPLKGGAIAGVLPAFLSRPENKIVETK